MSSPQERNLTELEYRALSAKLNLADGHARTTLLPETRHRLLGLLESTLSDQTMQDVTVAKDEFLTKLGARTGQSYAGSGYPVYSASLALDVAAKYLATKRLRTGLVVPTFDNLAALLRLSGVPTVPVVEAALLPACDVVYLDKCGVNALVVVMPNNPTGTVWSDGEAERFFTWAAVNKVTVVLDLSFRLLDDRACLDYVLLAESLGASLITIDDTGKAISLSDSKIGLIAATADMRDDIWLIVSEMLLSVSGIELRLLADILTVRPESLDEVTQSRKTVAINRAQLSRSLEQVARSEVVTASADGSLSSVEWLYVGEKRAAIVSSCRAQGMEVLPGSQFYWNQASGSPGDCCIRMALMRPKQYFADGLQVFMKVIEQAYAR